MKQDKKKNQISQVLSLTYDRIECDKCYFRVKYGQDTCLVDAEKGEFLHLVYEDIKVVNAQLFLVKHSHNWGVVDKRNKVILPFIYKDIKAVTVKGKVYYIAATKNKHGQLRYGVLDAKGKVIISAKYDTVDIYNDEDIETYDCEDALGIIRATKLDRYYLFDLKGKPLTNKSYTDVSLCKTGYWVVYKKCQGFIDFQGKEIIPCKYDGLWEEDAFLFRVFKKKRFGVLTRDNHVVLPPVYESASAHAISSEKYYLIFQSKGKYGLKIVTFQRKGTSSKKTVRSTSKEKSLFHVKDELPAIYNDISDAYYNKGYFKVCLDGDYYLYDTRRNKFLSHLYEDIKVIDTNRFLVKKKESDKWGVVDHNNKVLIPLDYGYIEPITIKGQYYYIVESSSRGGGYPYGVLNAKGDTILQAKYDLIVMDTEGTATSGIEVILAMKDRKHYFFDLKGKMLTKNIYTEAYWYKTGFLVERRNDWGFVNFQGLEIVPCRYDAVEELGDQFFIVRKKGKHGLLTRSNQLVLPIRFDTLEVRPLQNNRYLILYSIKGKYGLNILTIS